MATLKILFKYEEFLFIGEVQRYFNGGTLIYNTYYALFHTPSDLEEVEIYKGKGKSERLFWRQRVNVFEPKLKEPELIKIIGNAIQIQENIESK